ncbi:MBL fold metallo-hydrolase [Vibrio sp. PP-XX7]
MPEPLMMVDGERLEVMGPLRGDSDEQSVLWIPSIKTLVAADTVFAHAHVWVADDKVPEMRQAWLKTLDQLEALKPEVVVPGHAPSVDYISPDAIAFTREYLLAFEDVLQKADGAEDIVEVMTQRYPDFAAHICLEYSARILKEDGYQWPGEWPQSLRDLKPVF